MTADEIQTVTLRSGEVVLGKFQSGTWYPVTYANRTQAYDRQMKLGDAWEVIRRGRPWFLRRKESV
jgi:hypothetical protein